MAIRDENPRLNEENPWHISVTTPSGQVQHPAIQDDFDDALLAWLQRFGPEVGELALRDAPPQNDEDAEFDVAVDDWLQSYMPEGTLTDPGRLLATITIEARRGDQLNQARRQVRLYRGNVELSVLGEQYLPSRPLPPEPLTLQLHDGADNVLQEYPLDDSVDAVAYARALLPEIGRQWGVARTLQPGKPAYFVARRGRRTMWAAHIECHHAWAFVAPNHSLWTA